MSSRSADGGERGGGFFNALLTGTVGFAQTARALDTLLRHSLYVETVHRRAPRAAHGTAVQTGVGSLSHTVRRRGSSERRVRFVGEAARRGAVHADDELILPSGTVVRISGG